MKARFKSEVARAAGVHRSTLWRWLKKQGLSQPLASLDINPKNKKLPGRALKLICNHYVIDIDEDA